MLLLKRMLRTPLSPPKLRHTSSPLKSARTQNKTTLEPEKVKISKILAVLFVGSFVFSLARSFVHSLVRSSIRSFVRSFVRSLARSFVRPFPRAFVRSSIRSFVRLLTRLLVPSVARLSVHLFLRKIQREDSSVRLVCNTTPRGKCLFETSKILYGHGGLHKKVTFRNLVCVIFDHEGDPFFLPRGYTTVRHQQRAT